MWRRCWASCSPWRAWRSGWAATGTQLELAVAQSHPQDPSKTALLWAARTQLGHLSRAELRTRCDELLGNPLVVPAYPRYLRGFVHALQPVPALTDFVVETVSNAFGRLPDPVLLPWLPSLITTLQPGAELAPLLTREAGRIFPGRLAALDRWVPPWRAQPEPEPVHSAQSTGADRGDALLAALGDPGRGATVTPTVLAAGDTANTVPGSGSFAVGTRFWAANEQQRGDMAMRQLRPTLPGASVELTGGPNRPPLPAQSSSALFTRATRLARSLGLGELIQAAVGGGSDGNLTRGQAHPPWTGSARGRGAHTATTSIS
jgi:hypothetical protein